jgi:hypothetical protein
MTKLPILTAVVVAAIGLAAPTLAATSFKTDAVPFCATGNGTDIDSRADALATQLQLSTKQQGIVDVSNGCLKVLMTENGKTTVAYYDPDSLKQVG